MLPVRRFIVNCGRDVIRRPVDMMISGLTVLTSSGLTGLARGEMVSALEGASSMTSVDYLDIVGTIDMRPLVVGSIRAVA